MRQRGLDAASVIGELAASLALVPPGSRLSAAELLRSLDPARLDACLRRPRSPSELDCERSGQS